MITCDAQTTAAQKLRTAVRALVRARWRQVAADAVFGGLFCGLLSACVALLLIRLGLLRPPIAAPWVVVGLLGLALTTALLIAWRRRPDPLQVAIQADLQLKLQQRLSTAWEFVSVATDPALGDRLAVQAVRARLPQQPWFVFPLRVNLWGRLTPVAATLLVLLSVVDLRPVVAPPAVTVHDSAVVEQGVGLRDYGRRMEQRARHEALPRSTRGSQNIQRLGSRMASGTLARDEALEWLRRLSANLGEQRQAALSAGSGAELDSGRRRPASGQDVSAWPASDDAGQRALLEDLTAARPAADNTSPSLSLSPAQRQALTRFDISADNFASARRRPATGDDRQLRLREVLTGDSAALREVEELDQAQQRITRAREQLGDATLAAAAEGDRDPAGADDAPGLGPAAADGGDGGVLLQPGGSLAGYGVGQGQQHRLPFTEQAKAEVGLRPVSRQRAGEVFSAPVRVLPRPGQPTLSEVELNPRFSAQLEEALSKEDVPLHQKELVRRYFLTLSEGVAEQP